MSKIDQEVVNLINDVNKRKSEIAKLSKINWITNCSFSFSENKLSELINIHVEKNIKTLIGIAGFLISSEKSYNDAVNKLEVDAPPFKWNGYKVSDWISDIQNRINQVEIASKKAKLETLENRLNSIVSPELRAELELKAIKEALNDN